MPAASLNSKNRKASADGRVALTLLIARRTSVVTVAPAPLKFTQAKTSQSPAKSEILPALVEVAVVRAPPPVPEITSPTLPVVALSFVLVPKS